MIWDKPGRCTIAILNLAVLVAAFALPETYAQTQPAASNIDHKPEAGVVRTFYLTNCTDVNQLNEIQTSLRNMFSRPRFFGDSSHYAITMRGTQEEIDAAQKLISDLDRPRRVYRLTYTLTNSDGGKRTGVQHFVLLAVAGQRSTFKQGIRVPVVTGVKGDRGDAANEVQYVDTGLNIEAQLSGAPDALSLHSRIVQSSPSNELPVNATKNPPIHQTSLEESFQLAQGKPLMLGSFDFPGTTRHQEIEVVAEQVR